MRHKGLFSTYNVKELFPKRGCLDRWEKDLLLGQVWCVVFLTGKIDVNKDGPILYILHGWILHKLAELLIWIFLFPIYSVVVEILSISVE